MTTPPPPGYRPSVAAPLTASDPRWLGPYRLVGRLGQGGMGTVYLGRKRDGGPWVAIKVIRPELADSLEFRARFRREAENARRVARFCTASVLDADPEAERPYLVTEYVEGLTLTEAVEARGPLRTADLEQLAVSVATALTAIHGAGVVHRDLSPSNVLLSAVGPKVIDFGVARATDVVTLAGYNIQMGTPGYMAPEQVLGHAVTPAADVFSWGGVVLYAGTGQRPFGHGPVEAVLYRVVNEQPPLYGLDAGLRRLATQAMQKDPAARPSAQQILMHLIGESTVLGGPLRPVAGPAPGDPATPAPGAPGIAPSAPSAPSAPTAAAQAARAAGAAGSVVRPGAAASVTAAPAPGQPGTEGTSGSAAPAQLSVSARSARSGAGPAPPSPPTPAAGTPLPDGGRRGRPRRIRFGRGAEARTADAKAGAADATPTGIAPVAPPPDPDGTRPGRPPQPLAEPVRWPPAPPAPLGRPQPPAAASPAALGESATPSIPTNPIAAPPGAAGDDRAAVDDAAAPAPDWLADDPAGTAGTAGGPSPSPGTGTAERPRPTYRPATGLAPTPAAGTPLSPPPRRHRRRAGVVAAIVAVVVAGAAAAATMISMGKNDPPAPDRAPIARRLAADADRARKDDPALARRLSLAAYRLAVTPETQRAVVASFAGTSVRTVISDRPGLGRIAISRDGTMLAATGPGPHAQLWSIAAAGPATRLATLAGTGHMTSVAFSQASDILVAASTDETARVWDVRDPRHPSLLARVSGHISPVEVVAISPDSRTLVTGAQDGSVRFWDITRRDKPKVLATLNGHFGPVQDIAFAPDGKVIATVGVDGTARLWDVTDPNRPSGLSEFTAHTGAVESVDFSPDGRRLATGGDDGTARLWDVSDRKRPRPLSLVGDRNEWIIAVAFGHGTMLAAAHGRTVDLFDVTDPASPARVASVSGPGTVDSEAFRVDDGSLFAAGADGVVRAWTFDATGLASQACSDSANHIGPTEWNRYVREIPYTSPCRS